MDRRPFLAGRNDGAINMSFKFEKLDVWKISLDYCDAIYELAEKLPDSERFNLKSHITRAATSVSLNIAEGSTSQSDTEQSRFLGLAIRSLIESVACQRLILRRNYVSEKDLYGAIGFAGARTREASSHLPAIACAA
jgi:four helix bundle protein